MQENRQIQSLISLLDEPDESAFGVIREHICTLGDEAIPSLEEARENTFDQLVQARIEWLLQKIRHDRLRSAFDHWIAHEQEDLLKGFFLVSQTAQPDLKESVVMEQITRLRMDIWLELNDNLTALENIRVINRILFDIHHFEGNRVNISEPRNFFLHTLLETHKGSPLSLGMLYLILARLVNLPVYGVNLPQHFILACLADPVDEPVAEDVLFYLNPFNKGAVFTRREIELFIRQMKMKPESSHFTPCTNVEIIRRLLQNLIQSYSATGSAGNLQILEELLDATS